MKIISVVGARPNFMKIAPFIRAINVHNDSGDSEKIEHILVHTGQHYDDRMSKAFFETLGIPKADINLGVGSGTHAEQVGYTMIAFEKVIKRKNLIGSLWWATSMLPAPVLLPPKRRM